MKRIPLIVSVDWDYFLPFCTDRRYDWGHHEGNPLFYEVIWHMRAMPFPKEHIPKGCEPENLINKIQVDTQRVAHFWNKVLVDEYPRRVCVQDSHGKLPEFVSQIGTKVDVVNFDAHHDAGYGQTRRQDCSNWAHFLKKSGHLNTYTLVYPKWRKDEPEGKIPAHVDRVMYGEWDGPKLKAEAVFICRSSCWMPPWLDDQWLRLRENLLYRGPMSGYECEYVKTARKWNVNEL